MSEQTSLTEHATTALLTNAFMQPIRVLLNCAAISSNPIATIAQALPNLQRGMQWNVLRGTAALCGQTMVQEGVGKHFDPSTPIGRFYAILAPATVGTMVSVTVETLFIRVSMGLRGMRFSMPLVGFYFLREIGFSLVVLGPQNLTPAEKNGVMFVSTGVTAFFHKKAVLEATSDAQKKPSPVPTKSGLYKMAAASNMFLFRGLYLGVYAQVLDSTRRNVTPEVMKRLGI